MLLLNHNPNHLIDKTQDFLRHLPQHGDGVELVPVTVLYKEKR